MSGEDFVDDQDDFFFDDDYLYVEDDITAADELAESQIPSPGYAGTNAELAAEFYEWDNYEYYADLKYGSDSYWDSTPRKQKSKKSSKTSNNGIETGQKRKRLTTSRQIPDKKRRFDGSCEGVTHTEGHINNVLFRQVVPEDKQVVPTVSTDDTSFALFPDWKKRFPMDVELVENTVMPEEMKRAAEGDQNDDGTRLQRSDIGADMPVISNKKKRKAQATRRVEVEEAEDDGDDGTGLDLVAIQSVLQQRLGNAGLKSEQFMDAISKMLSGGSSSDEAMEALTSALLEQTNKGDDAAHDWLREQGVTFETQDDNDYQDETSAKRIDSGAGIGLAAPDKDAQITETKSTTGRKRKAETDVTERENHISDQRQTRSSPRKTRKMK